MDRINIVQENVRNIYNHGIPVLAGTDSVLGSYYPVRLPFGQTLHEELQNLVDIGLSPAEALRAATIVPAKAHGLDDRGHLAPGMRADMLLLQPDADPLSDLSDAKKMSRVWNAGIEHTGPLTVYRNQTGAGDGRRSRSAMQ